MFAIKQTQKIRKNNMFIQKLKKLENTDLASALVKWRRSEWQEWKVYANGKQTRTRKGFSKSS